MFWTVIKTSENCIHNLMNKNMKFIDAFKQYRKKKQNKYIGYIRTKASTIVPTTVIVYRMYIGFGFLRGECNTSVSCSEVKCKLY